MGRSSGSVRRLGGCTDGPGMQIAIYFPALLTLAALLVYAFAKGDRNGELKALAYAAFCCGLLVTCFQLANHAIHFP